MTTEELLRGINAEDRTVPVAIGGTIPKITKLVDAIVARDGRIFYIGAGTSGRIGITDASHLRR